MESNESSLIRTEKSSEAVQWSLLQIERFRYLHRKALENKADLDHNKKNSLNSIEFALNVYSSINQTLLT